MSTTVPELAFTSALEQADLVRTRQVSPLELVRTYLERIERLNPILGAYFTVTAELAESEAGQAEARAGDPDAPPFLGVPVSIKDLHMTAGIPTSFGLKEKRDFVPPMDEVPVRKLRKAGFIILGKTAAPALGLGCVSEADGFPPARNPWDPERTPGGSSGGAGTAAAAGLCAVSHGSDGGGSIRIPSSWCGLVGVKPSRGRVSIQPRLTSLQAVIGPMARTVADAAAVLDVMSGPELGDQYWLEPPSRPFREEVGADPGRLRIALSLGGSDLDPEYRLALDETVTLLTELGHEIVEKELDPKWSRLYEDIIDVVAGVGVKPGLDLMGVDATTVDPIVKGQIEIANKVSADAYLATTNALLERARLVTQSLAEFDVLLSPVCAKAPPRIGQHRELSIRELFLVWERYVPFTTFWNQTGQPALSLPAGFGPTGLPLAVQLVGRPADEATLFRLAAQLEEARPWAHVRPNLD